MSGAVLGWLVLGALLGVLIIGFARRLRWCAQVRLFAVFLFLAGVIYLAFGAFHGPRWIAVEGAGLVLFSTLAAAGLRWPLVLAAGWLLHMGWDAGLHLALEQPVIGQWLPLICIPFDVMVAAYLAYAALAERRPAELAAVGRPALSPNAAADREKDVGILRLD